MSGCGRACKLIIWGVKGVTAALAGGMVAVAYIFFVSLTPPFNVMFAVIALILALGTVVLYRRISSKAARVLSSRYGEAASYALLLLVAPGVASALAYSFAEAGMPAYVMCARPGAGQPPTLLASEVASLALSAVRPLGLEHAVSLQQDNPLAAPEWCYCLAARSRMAYVEMFIIFFVFATLFMGIAPAIFARVGALGAVLGELSGIASVALPLALGAFFILYPITSMFMPADASFTIVNLGTGSVRAAELAEQQNPCSSVGVSIRPYIKRIDAAGTQDPNPQLGQGETATVTVNACELNACGLFTRGPIAFRVFSLVFTPFGFSFECPQQQGG